MTQAIAGTAEHAALISECTGQHTTRVLSASIAAAVRIALRQWLRPTAAGNGLVTVSGSLPDLLRTAIAPLAPALDAAERQPQQ